MKPFFFSCEVAGRNNSKLFQLAVICFCFFLPRYGDAASGSSLQDAPVPQESCTGTMLPAKGIKGRAIKNKEGIRVEAVFYLGADTVSFSAQTDYHGRFSFPLPPGYQVCGWEHPSSRNRAFIVGRWMGYGILS